jgi:putative ABC transport system permease protein
MNLFRLAWKSIGDNHFRSWVVSFCAALVACYVLGTTIIVQGTRSSLQKVVERLGADILVIPEGNQANVEHALLMGVPVTIWMPRSVASEIAALPGVAAVSPQLFLSTMRRASCCSVSDMFMIAYEPETDFTVHPWLEKNLGRDLGLGEAIGGMYVSVPEGRENILIYGYEIELAGNLEPSGSGLDQSMFFTFETALEIARLSPMQAERELVIAPDSISAALVRIDASADSHQVALQIENVLPGVIAIENLQMFRTQRDNILRFIKSAAALSVIAWSMSILLIGLVTSLAVAHRKREIGVLRALGASRKQVLLSLLTEGVLLSLAGGAAGIALTAFAIFLFRNLIIRQMEIPFLYPSPPALFLLVLAVLALTQLSVILATLFPILRISHLEPGTTIKEWE